MKLNTVKTTKKEERMAFFNLEDKFASVECIVFPSKYARESSKIRADAAVAVEGNVMLRDDEKVRIAVSSLSVLDDNERYIPRKNAEQHAESDPAEPQTSTQVKLSTVKRLFLRVPDRESKKFRKAVNLVDIFDGSTPVVFYTNSDKNYFSYNKGVALSEAVVKEFIELLGKENVIVK